MIPVAGPWITEREIEYVTDAARRAWYADANIYNQRFEEAFAAACGRRFAVALPSCTAGLHLALAALGIGPGDEVIVPDATWIASAAPVSYVGATPVFADVDARSWCVEAETFEAAVTPRTRALIVVDLYGNMPRMSALLEAAARRGIPVIEDAAEAAGARYRGRPAGAFGLASVFSFHGSKTLTTGEGGMLLCDDEPFFRRCLVLRDHGRQPGDRYFFNHEVAYKYKMSSLQAALGLAQLERLSELIARKRAQIGWYRARLHGDDITLNADLPDIEPSYWMITAHWSAERGVSTRTVMDALRERGVDSRPFFHPLSSLPAYAALDAAAIANQRNRVAYDLAPRGINLPSALSLTEDHVDRACRAFREVLDAYSRRRA